MEAAWTALGRRTSYLCFPGVRAAAPADPASRRRGLCHDLDLPIVDRREQVAVLTVSRGGATRERRFAVQGTLVSIAGRWRLDPLGAGVRLHLTLDYEIAPSLKTDAVNALRSRSPLPIRTDADVILSRAVDEFFATRFGEHAVEYCERLRARLDPGPAA
jgi:hypothetical protein